MSVDAPSCAGQHHGPALQMLSGHRVVVVGGTRGMGWGTAMAAAAAGADVIVAGREPPAARASIRTVALDVSRDDAVKAFFDGIGPLDHLVVTASPRGASKPFQELERAEVEAYLTTKLLGAWSCARHAAPRMRENGSITFLTGVAAIRPRVGMSTATTAFAAVEALGAALAVELGPIRVNTIRPGVIDSDMWNFLSDPERVALRERVSRAFPVGRIGSVDDIAHAMLFLMTNPYVTGTVLEVSGGEQLVAGF